MPLRLNQRLSLILLLSACLGVLACTARVSTVEPIDLRCEHLRNPVAVDVEVPRLSWKLEDAESTRGQKQTAYHIMVASRPELLAADQADLWDSGKVESDQSMLLSYGGEALASNQNCHWKVRVYDKDGLPSEWSEPAQFTMGLLRPDDWSAAWIVHPQMPGQSKPTNQGLDVTEAVAERIRGDRLSVVAGTKISGGVDPAHKIYKKLVVTYSDDGEERTAAVIDGHRLDLTGTDLRVISAVYGDYAVPVLDLTDRVRKEIRGDRLEVPVNLQTLSFKQDMAKGRPKLLRVRYRVGERSLQRDFALGETLRLPAPGDGSGPLVIDSVVLGDLDAPAFVASEFLAATEANEALPVTQHLWFRKNLQLEAAPESAVIHVASIGYHELFVNGKKVDDRLLAPIQSRIDKRVLYVSYDIAPLLQAGENTIALATGPGWSRYRDFDSFQALRAQLNGVDAEGRAFTLGTGGDWRCHPANSRNRGQIRYTDHGGEVFDARAHIEGWNLPGFDASEWSLAQEAEVAVELSAEMMAPTRVIETIPAQAISGDGPYRVDMGKNFTGWLEIKIRGQQPGDHIQIKVADDVKTIQDFGQLNVYVCKGGEERFQNRFNYIAGRYVTLEGLSQKPALGDVTGFALATDVERVGRFDSSEPLFNEIYDVDLWTYRANTTEGFTADCPHRERLGYGEVAFATTWAIGLPNYDSAAFYLKHIRDWSDVQEDNGWFNHTAPQVNLHFGGPLWSSAGLNIADVYYDYYGDPQAFERIFPAAERWLAFLHASVEDGLLRPYFGTENPNQLGRFLGDWAAPGGRKEFGNTEGALYFNNCVYAKNLEDVIRMAKRLGRVENVALYEARLADLRQKIHARFYDAETGEYVTGTPVQQAFALMVGVTPEPLREKVFAQLAADIEEKQYLDMGSSGLPILLKYLLDDAQRGDLLYKALLSRTRPSYGYFLERGETTWPEYWSVDVPSKIHTCYTGISSWMTKGLAGIRPDPAAPGFQSFIIQPLLAGDLSSAGATTVSPYGTVTSQWERADGVLTLQLEIPVNSRATVYLPTAEPGLLSESGTPVRDADGVTPLRYENGHAVLSVDSGSYRFTSVL